MNDPQLHKKFAVSDGPVNRRLMVPDDTPAEQDSPVAVARIQAALARQQLGATMADRLTHASGQSGKPGGLSTGDIVVVMGGAASAVGLTLGLIQSSVLIGGVGLVGLCGFGLRAWAAAKSRGLSDGAAVQSMSPLLDAQDVAKLDAALDKLALDAPQAMLDRLAALKDLVARCVALLASGTMANGAIGSSGASEMGLQGGNDDQFFIRETVRRYLPDSISSYLRVPQKDRASLVIDDGKTATDLLHAQLDMIEQQLTAKEVRLTQMAGESLMRQQRFLAAKTRGPTSY